MVPVIAQAEFLFAAMRLKGQGFDWVDSSPSSRFSQTRCWVLHVLQCMRHEDTQDRKRNEFLSQVGAMGVCLGRDGQMCDFTFEGVFRV